MSAQCPVCAKADAAGRFYEHASQSLRGRRALERVLRREKQARRELAAKLGEE